MSARTDANAVDIAAAPSPFSLHTLQTSAHRFALTDVTRADGRGAGFCLSCGGECAEVESTAQAQGCPACGERAAYGSHWIFAGGLLA